MEKNKIGENAGVIWRLLDHSQEKRCTYNELKEKSCLNERELNRAIGWLAREEKIQIDNDGLSLPHCQYF